MSAQAFDPLRALSVLVDENVEFLVIGGIAGRAWGSTTVTNDLDICYSRERSNLPRLARALRRLDARLRGTPPDLPFLLDEKTLWAGDSFTFETTAGDLDCLGTPSGTAGYRDLVNRAHIFDVGADMRVGFASLEDLIRMKRAAGRPKDLIEVEVLAAVAEEIRNRE